MSRGAIDKSWLEAYLDRYRSSLFESAVHEDLLLLRESMLRTRDRGGKVVLVGNGGSATIADHCAVDFTKNARVRSVSFGGAAWVSCLANDYGYENWVAKSLELYAAEGDLLILISSSGKSPNIINAATTAKELKIELTTFSGFDADNPLRKMGEQYFWVDSRAYNIVEMTHHIWLLAVCDSIIGTAEYSAS